MALTNRDYTVGWISALPIEMAASMAMMDKPIHPSLPQASEDTNKYTLGRIGSHNVVMVCLAGMGTNTAARTAVNLLRSFPNVRFGLMVGIGGGAPGPPNVDPMKDIRLGDVVVGTPGNQHGGVIQYDFGTAVQQGQSQKFLRKSHLNKPPPTLLTALKNIQARNEMEPTQLSRHYDEMLEKYPVMAMKYFKPESESDRLFASDYQHRDENNCMSCSDHELVSRKPRSDSVVHYGLIGSANQVLRDASVRDRLRADEGIICFEMEAAGLIDEFPCIVIRGICDYCDTHKSKEWQPYASVVASGFAKELLLTVPASVVVTLPHVPDLASLVQEQQYTNNLLRQIDTKLDIDDSGTATNKHKDCLDVLKCVHPRYDKRRLEEAKGGLLRDAYKWILQNEEYMSWRANGGLLWINGDPGKGKSMLLCGVITELDADTTVYFFCQATVNTNNTAVFVLRGLIFSMLEHHPSLSDSVYDRLRQASELPDATAFYILAEVFEELLAVRNMAVLIDALDECLEGLDQLLHLIVKVSTAYSSHWLVSSRNIMNIGEHLERSRRLSLELNDVSVANAVNVFIEHKVKELSQAKKYDDALRSFVMQYLLTNAQGTFLWVSLVCLSLSKTRLRHTRTVLLQYPSGLKSVYQHMLEGIEDSSDADILKQILATVCVVFRPLTFAELGSLMQVSHQDKLTLSWVEDLVNDCGSFLTTRDSTVQLVHQSAKDFLVAQHEARISSDGMAELHRHIFAQCIESLQFLKKNMYSLAHPGTELKDIRVPNPDPLAEMTYASIYWMDHLLEFFDISETDQMDLADAQIISGFMKSKALYWLEAVSLLGEVYPALTAMTKLYTKIQKIISQSIVAPETKESFKGALDIVFDVLQFIRFFQYSITRFPLQIYVSGLLFSPERSLLKSYFQHETPKWAVIGGNLRKSWPKSLSLDAEFVRRLQFSRDGEQLATLDGDGHLCVWGTVSGQLLATHRNERLLDYTFSMNGDLLMFLCGPGEQIQSWSTQEGQLATAVDLQVLDSSQYSEESMQAWLPEILRQRTDFSHTIVFCNDASRVAWLWEAIPKININCTKTGALLWTITQEVWPRTSLWPTSLVFNMDDSMFAVADAEKVRVWNVKSGDLFCSFPRSDREGYLAMTFSPCSEFLTVFKNKRHHPDYDYRLWDSPGVILEQWNLKEQIQVCTIECENSLPKRPVVILLPATSTLLVCSKTAVEEWSMSTMKRLRTCEMFPGNLTCIAVSNDGCRIAASDGASAKIWAHNLGSENITAPLKINNGRTESVYLSDNKLYALELSPACSINVWSPRQQNIMSTILTSNIDAGLKSRFSSDGTQVLVFSASYDILENWCLIAGCERRTRIPTEGTFGAAGWGPGQDEITVHYVESQLIHCWNMKSAQITMRLPDPAKQANSSPIDLLWSVGLKWSPTKGHLILVIRDSIHLWTAQSGIWTLLAKDMYSLPHSTDPGCFDTDGKLYAYIDSEEILILFRIDRQEMIMRLHHHGGSSLLSIDSQWLKTDKIWYSISEDCLASKKIHYRLSENVSLSPSDQGCSWIQMGSDNLIWLPPEYRPRTSNVKGDTIGMYLCNYEILIVEVHWDRSKDIDHQSSAMQNPWPLALRKRRRSSSTGNESAIGRWRTDAEIFTGALS